MTSETINSIFGISESFELPEKLMNILLSGQEQKCFEKFLILRPDLSKDWFTDYFQESHSNREKMMQDFTPHELSGLLPEMAGEFHIVQDICAGTGGLTIAAWTKNPDAVFVRKRQNTEQEQETFRNFPICGILSNEKVLSETEMIQIEYVKTGRIMT